MRLSYLSEGYRSATWDDIANTIDEIVRERYSSILRLPTQITIGKWHLSRLGKGAYRWVYRLHIGGKPSRVVVKIGDRTENEREAMVYAKASTYQRGWLAKHLALSKDQYVSIFEYIPKPSKAMDKIKMLNLRDRGHVSNSIDDLHGGNIRRTESGHPKIVDYAQ